MATATAEMVRKATVRGCLSEMVLSLLISRARAPGRRRRVRSRWRTLTSISGTTGNADGDGVARACPLHSLRAGEIYPSLAATTTWRRRVEAGRGRIARLRSFTIPASPRETSGPDGPDVSYWRNMARSCEIFPRALEALSPPTTYI